MLLLPAKLCKTVILVENKLVGKVVPGFAQGGVHVTFVGREKPSVEAK